MANKSTSFLKLPGEIRNHIYRALLVAESGISIRSHPRASNFGICLVNRQIRQETVPIFYSENVFREEIVDRGDYFSAERWFRNLHPANAALLRHLSLRFDKVKLDLELKILPLTGCLVTVKQYSYHRRNFTAVGPAVQLEVDRLFRERGELSLHAQDYVKVLNAFVEESKLPLQLFLF